MAINSRHVLVCVRLSVCLCVCAYLCVQESICSCACAWSQQIWTRTTAAHNPQRTVHWQTHTHTLQHIPQANLCSHWIQTRFQNFKIWFEISAMAITVYALPQHKSACRFVVPSPPLQNCHLPVQSANKLPLYRVNLTHPAFLGLLFFFYSFFFALILLDIAFVQIFNAINSLSEHCLSRERSRGRGGVGNCEQVKTFWRLL